MPRDILSRSRNGPQQQSQPALLPDKKGRQRLLEGGAALGKFDFHAHAAHAKAVRIDGPFHKPGQPLLPGEGAVKGHTAHVSQRIRAHRADVHAFHLFQLLCGQFHGKTSFAFLVGGETRKGSTPKSAALWPVLTLGQFVSNLFEMGSAGPVCLARQKTASSGPAFPCFVRRPQAASGQLVPRGSWPWGWQVPHTRRWCWSLVLPLEKSPRTRRPAPRVHPGPPAIQLWRRKNFLSYTETFFHHFQVGNLKKIKKFFSCAPAHAGWTGGRTPHARPRRGPPLSRSCRE